MGQQAADDGGHCLCVHAYVLCVCEAIAMREIMFNRPRPSAPQPLFKLLPRSLPGCACGWPGPDSSVRACARHSSRRAGGSEGSRHMASTAEASRRARGRRAYVIGFVCGLARWDVS